MKSQIYFGFKCIFSTSKKIVSIGPDDLVLDIAEENDIEIDASCRSGSCGTCLAKLSSGEVEMECDDALSDEEKSKGMILTCQAKPKSDIDVDA